MSSSNRNKGELGTYFRVLSYLRPYAPRLVFVFLLNGLFIVFNMLSLWMIPVFPQALFGGQEGTVRPAAPSSLFEINDWLKYQYFELVGRPSPAEAIELACILIFATFLLKNVFQFAEQYVVSYVEQRVIKDLRDEVFTAVLRKPLAFYSQYDTGNLISRLTNDINDLNVAVNRSFTKLIRDPVLIVLSMMFLFSINVGLTFFALIVIPVSGIVIRQIGKSLKRRSTRVQQMLATITSDLQDKLSGIKVVHAFSQEDAEAERFQEYTERHFRAALKKVRTHRLSSPLSETLGILIMISVLLVGGRQVLTEGGMQAEDFIRFLAILFGLLQPIKSLADLNNNVQIALASGARVFEIVDHPAEIPERPDAVRKSSLDERIEYTNVSFRYAPSEPLVLDDVSFTIEKNQTVALVGPSGAGKSTIAQLLPRFYDVEGGSIRVDGVDVRDLALRDLRRLIGVVSQDVTLFNDTVRNNIAYGLPDVSDERIEAAAEAANALHFIQALPEGFETMVGERGVRLSGGERQRISIARALLANPPILVLDEATSSLDAESEALIQDALERLMEDRTVLSIAHRLATVRKADKILVIEDGRLAEEGSHTDLLDQSERYRRYYELQVSQ
ncbi:MAG: ABC transporter ATP-binding protein [Candidatus Eisenbacteria bacterium]|nr:ABC transporter ATP-binding protein [Candidatus Eisenbacteria bacterium]